jgi:hypothetical protein
MMLSSCRGTHASAISRQIGCLDHLGKLWRRHGRTRSGVRTIGECDGSRDGNSLQSGTHLANFRIATGRVRRTAMIATFSTG